MSCKILLDNAQGYYSPGQLVSGRVQCQFNDSTTLRSVKISLRCKEHIGWKVGRSHFNKDNIILLLEQDLLMSEDPVEHSGIDFFSFSFVLPYELPSSFRSFYGTIECSLKAKIDVPLWIDPTHTISLLIHAPTIFNTIAPDYPQYAIRSAEKPINICCFNRGNLAMQVELPTTVFVLGETVNFQVTVQNLSSLNVDSLTVTLVQKITYGPPSVPDLTRSSTVPVAGCTKSGVGAHGERFYDLALTMPESYQILNFVGSRFISDRYCLRVSCNLLHSWKTVYVDIPDIRLGHSKCDVSTLENWQNVVHLPSPQNYIIFIPPDL